MEKIVFSPSQQKANEYYGGPTVGDSEEFWMGLLAIECKRQWDAQSTGIPAYVVDTGTLSGNVTQSNSLDATVHLALHTNAGGGNGTEAWARKNLLGVKSSGGTKLMENVYPFIAAVSDMPDRGMKWSSGYYELNHTKAYAVIIEYLFHDNAAEAEEMRKSIAEFATATVQGLCKHYGRGYLPGGATVPQPKPQPKPKPPAPSIVIPPTIHRGAHGSVVMRLQRALNAHGYRLAVDGDFGPKTHNAVIAFQRKNRLAVDGIVGPKTWKKVLS